MSAEPITAQVEAARPHLRELIREVAEQGTARSNRAIAEHLLEQDANLLALIPWDEQVRVLADFVKTVLARDRQTGGGFQTQRMTVGDSQEAVLRISLAGTAYWSALWNIGGVLKETRDLTTKDVEWLIRDRRQRAGELIAQVKWLEVVRDFARTHQVRDTLGELEAKGLDLPTLDVPEDQ